jgi:hypothetical protein
VAKPSTANIGSILWLNYNAYNSWNKTVNAIYLQGNAPRPPTHPALCILCSDKGKPREVLLQGKTKYGRPPFTYYLRSGAFDNLNIIYYLQNKLPK